MLQVGVVGVGNRATILGESKLAGTDLTVVAFADPSSTARERGRVLFPGAVGFRTVEELLAGATLDAVFVMSPDHRHHVDAAACLGNGTPVYLDKPMATHWQDCDALLELARAERVKLYLGHNLRQMPVMNLLHSVVADGAIGDVTSVWIRHFVGHGGDYYFKDWHADRAGVNSLLVHKGCHDIDVAHWLAGGYATRASAFGKLGVYDKVPDRRPPGEPKPTDYLSLEHWPPMSQTRLNPVIDMEDLAIANFELDSGCLVSYQQCMYTPDYWRNFTVIGTRGRVENFGDQSGGVVKVWNAGRSGYRSDADTEYAIPAHAGPHGGADRLILREFANYLTEDGPVTCSPVDARMAVAACVAATESMRTAGSTQDVAPLDPTLADWFDQPGAERSEALEGGGVDG